MSLPVIHQLTEQSNETKITNRSSHEMSIYAGAVVEGT